MNKEKRFKYTFYFLIGLIFSASPLMLLAQENVSQNAQQPLTAVEQESFSNLSEVIKEINDEAEITHDDLREIIRRAITDAISSIGENSDTNTRAAFQNAVDGDRVIAYNDIRSTIIDKGEFIDVTNIQALTQRLTVQVERIETILELQSGQNIDLSEAIKAIQTRLARFSSFIQQRREALDKEQGLLVYSDTDGDGLSDYDELNLYNTDPNQAYTIPGDLTDGQKIQAGIDPRSPQNERIVYEDAQADTDALISPLYEVTKITSASEDILAAVETGAVFEGKAFPNSFVVLYIYSTPLVVTVRTDANGNWIYVLDRELNDGNHLAYVATVDNSGKIVARSEATPFTKKAEAYTLGEGAIQPNAEEIAKSFLERYFWIIISVLFVLGLIIVLALIGQNTKKNQGGFSKKLTSKDLPEGLFPDYKKRDEMMQNKESDSQVGDTQDTPEQK